MSDSREATITIPGATGFQYQEVVRLTAPLRGLDGGGVRVEIQSLAAGAHDVEQGQLILAVACDGQRCGAELIRGITSTVFSHAVANGTQRCSGCPKDA